MCSSSALVFASMMWLVISPSATRPTLIGVFGLFAAETAISDQLDKYVFPSLTTFIISVLCFLPWCNSKGVIFSPVCIVKRITRNARFALWVKLILSSKFVIFEVRLNFYRDFSTTQFPVCIRGV